MPVQTEGQLKTSLERQFQRLCMERGHTSESLLQAMKVDCTEQVDTENALFDSPDWLDLLDRCCRRLGIELIDVFNVPGGVHSQLRHQVIAASRDMSEAKVKQLLTLAKNHEPR